jgi:hypothetical protein
MLLFFPGRTYVILSLIAGTLVAAGYILLGFSLWNRFGPNLYLLAAIGLGAVSMPYVAGRAANALVGQMWRRLTLEHPQEVVSVSVLPVDPVRVRAMSRFPITFKGSVAYLWIHADPDEVRAFIDLAATGSEEVGSFLPKESS